jgi:hypothetical protein
MMIVHNSPLTGKLNNSISAPWTESTADDPCPVCWRSDGCRVAGDNVACVWYPEHHLAETRSSSNGMRYGLYDRRTFRHVPPIETAVELLTKHFFSRTDLLCFAPPWDSPACPAIGEDALPHLLRAHLGGPKVRVPWKTARKEGVTRQSGRWRFGSYGPAPDGTTRWVVADFDGGEDHAEPLADPLAVALTAYRRFWQAGIACYLERSRSCSGWHLWVLLAKAISAAKARALALALLPDDALNIDGEVAAIEVFPKKDVLGNCRVGHQMWLPWFCDARKGGNVFYRPYERGLIPFIPEEFETVADATVDRLLAKEGART